MSIKPVFFGFGYALSWLIALPVFIVGGAVALFVYAVFAEVGDFFIGNSAKTETLDARERARLMCLGH